MFISKVMLLLICADVAAPRGSFITTARPTCLHCENKQGLRNAVRVSSIFLNCLWTMCKIYIGSW